MNLTIFSIKNVIHNNSFNYSPLEVPVEASVVPVEASVVPVEALEVLVEPLV